MPLAEELARRAAGISRGLPSTAASCAFVLLERDAVSRAVDPCGDDARNAAELLGISRAKINQRLKEYRGER